MLEFAPGCLRRAGGFFLEKRNLKEPLVYDHDSRPMADEELDSSLCALNEDVRREEEQIAQDERILFRLILSVVSAVALLILVASLSGCGGETQECRPADFVGPPSPGDDRPICKD
jgi:hypothetical protein